MKNKIKINLQRFAELDNPVPVETTPTPAPEGQPVKSIDERLIDLFNQAKTEDAQTATEIQQPTEPQNPAETKQSEENTPVTFDFNSIMERIRAINSNAAEKYKTPEALAETVVNQEKTITNLFQDRAQLTQQLNNLRAEIEALKGQHQQPQQQIQQQSDEFENLDGQDFMDKFYEDPKGFLAKFAEKVAKKAIEPYLNPLKPVIEQQQDIEAWNHAVNNMLEIDPDMVNHIDGMRQYLNDNGLVNSKEPQKAVVRAYIETLKNKAVDVNALLQDQNFIQERILKNPDIVNAVLKAHMQEVKNSQPPPAITGSGNGQPLAMPPKKANSMNEALKQFESMLNGNFVR